MKNVSLVALEPMKELYMMSLYAKQKFILFEPLCFGLKCTDYLLKFSSNCFQTFVNDYQ